MADGHFGMLGVFEYLMLLRSLIRRLDQANALNQRLLTDVAPQVDAAIKKAFKDQQPRYYYLYAIGTEHQHQRKGKEALLCPGPGAISPE